MQDEKFIRERITKLRLNKNVSEYRMSLDLGHSDSYIRNITSGKALPSMSEFLYICEYFNITPKEFFDEDSNNPELINELVSISNGLNNEDLLVLISMAKRKYTDTPSFSFLSYHKVRSLNRLQSTLQKKIIKIGQSVMVEIQ